MSRPAPRCARLVAALEDLAAQEEASARVGELAELAAVQARAAEVVAGLTDCADELDAGLRVRLIALHEQRERTRAWLAERIEEQRAALLETQRARGRVARIAPVYGAAPTSPRVSARLSAVG